MPTSMIRDRMIVYDSAVRRAGIGAMTQWCSTRMLRPSTSHQPAGQVWATRKTPSPPAAANPPQRRTRRPARRPAAC